MSSPAAPTRMASQPALFAPHPGLFLPDLEVADKNELFGELVEALVEHNAAHHRGALWKALVERERVGTTAVGHGVAIPHTRSMVVGATALVFARLRRALDFGATDGLPVRVVILIVAPYGLTGALYVPLLGVTATCARAEVGRERLLAVETFQDFETLMRQYLKPAVLETLAR